MSDNNTAKGVGLLAMLSLMFAQTCKTCDHEGSTFLKGCKSEAHDIKPSEGFSCTRPHVSDVPPIVQVDEEVKFIRSEDEVFLKKTSEDEFSYTDKNTNIFNALSDVNIDKSKPLIVDGALTEDEIKILNKKGVNFICNKEIYDQQKNITKYQLIFVFPEDRHVLKDLYGVSDDQVDDLINVVQPALSSIFITKATSKESLNGALASCKGNNITPVVIFNNKDNMLFDIPFSSYDISNAITCNSYNLGTELFLTSTNYIGIGQVVKSLATIDQPTLFDFYRNFSSNYATQLYKDKKYMVTVVATGTAAVGGTAGFIIYYNLNKES